MAQRYDFRQKKDSPNLSAWKECPLITSRHSDGSTDKNTLYFLPGRDTVGTFDTVKIYTPYLSEKSIKQRFSWYPKGAPFGSVLEGESGFERIIYFSETGADTGKGNHVGTVGIYRDKTGFGVITCSSAPALVYGVKYSPLRPEDIPQFQSNLQNLVAEHLDADISNWQLSRLDSSTVYSMHEKASVCIGLLNAITPDRQHRMDKKYYDGESLQFFNSSRSYGVYDKGLQAEIDANLLRPELQLKNAKSISRILGAGKTFNDLSDGGVIKKMVAERFKVFQMLFPFDYKKAKKYENHIAFMNAYRNEGKRNAPLHWLASLALVSGQATIDEVTKNMERVGYSRSAIKDTMKKLHELNGLKLDAIVTYSEIISQMYREVSLVA